MAKQFRPQKIILFGSYAYGKPTPDSDVDLLVIMPRTRYRGERMSVRIRLAVTRNFPMDLLVRTPADVAKRLRWRDPFISEIMEKGKVLYEAADAGRMTQGVRGRGSVLECASPLALWRGWQCGEKRQRAAAVQDLAENRARF